MVHSDGESLPHVGRRKICPRMDCTVYRLDSEKPAGENEQKRIRTGGRRRNQGRSRERSFCLAPARGEQPPARPDLSIPAVPPLALFHSPIPYRVSGKLPQTC